MAMIKVAGYKGAVIVIPTRNRASLVRNAITSVLTQTDCEVEVLVSDNSTSASEDADVRRVCEECNDSRLRYVRPPEPLPMSQHWDWAVQTALSMYPASHIALLTDRMVFKPGALKPLFEIIAVHPDKILTYMHDMVDDYEVPVVVRQYTWTGDIYEVRTLRLLELTAQSVMYDTAVPRMLNCLVPRRVLEAIRRRFGNFFASISPDWNFAYRALEREDSILFYDKASMVHYAQNLSNGQSAHYGIKNEAYNTFMRDVAGQPFNKGAPIPEIVTIWNGVISEYCQVKDQTRSYKFREVDLGNYLHVLAWGVEQIRDPDRREEMRRHLAAHGWQPATAGLQPPVDSTSSIGESLADTEFSVNAVKFEDPKRALQYALNCPRARSASSTHRSLLQGVPVALDIEHPKDQNTQVSV
jgi:glycosyltransferase involved in cell wall biosynthesis